MSNKFLRRFYMLLMWLNGSLTFLALVLVVRHWLARDYAGACFYTLWSWAAFYACLSSHSIKSEIHGE